MSEQWVFDANVDGVVDQTAWDTDHDGRADVWAFDANQNGLAEEVGVDSDRDGTLDAASVDHDEDAVVDYQLTDLDRDGHLETIIPGSDVDTSVGPGTSDSYVTTTGGPGHSILPGPDVTIVIPPDPNIVPEQYTTTTIGGEGIAPMPPTTNSYPVGDAPSAEFGSTPTTLPLPGADSFDPYGNFDGDAYPDIIDRNDTDFHGS